MYSRPARPRPAVTPGQRGRGLLSPAPRFRVTRWHSRAARSHMDPSRPSLQSHGRSQSTIIRVTRELQGFTLTITRVTPESPGSTSIDHTGNEGVAADHPGPDPSDSRVTPDHPGLWPWHSRVAADHPGLWPWHSRVAANHLEPPRRDSTVPARHIDCDSGQPRSTPRSRQHKTAARARGPRARQRAEAHAELRRTGAAWADASGR
jgi:hypothetical protein